MSNSQVFRMKKGQGRSTYPDWVQQWALGVAHRLEEQTDNQYTVSTDNLSVRRIKGNAAVHFLTEEDAGKDIRLTVEQIIDIVGISQQTRT